MAQSKQGENSVFPLYFPFKSVYIFMICTIIEPLTQCTAHPSIELVISLDKIYTYKERKQLTFYLVNFVIKSGPPSKLLI